MEGEPALHYAARIGDADEIRRLVAAGESIDAIFNLAQGAEGYTREATPLMVAAGSNDGATEETVRLLLELGADPKLVIGGNSASTFACEGLGRSAGTGGDAKRLRLVLAAGSPLPSHPAVANSLLCDTAATGDPDRLRVLLDRGISAKGHWDPARALELHRALMEKLAALPPIDPDDPELLSEEDRSSMAQFRAEFEEKMCAREISAPSSYEIPLFQAAESGSAECVRLLLEAGADPHVRDNSNETAMYSATSTAVVQELIKAGLALEDANEYGWSPLDDAVCDGEAALPRIRALIEAGANVNATHDRGYTVFMSAVGSERHPEVLRLLIASGADPHAVSDLGYNAFHAAIDVDGVANSEESVRGTFAYLKELGVDMEQRTKGGQTPLAHAIHRGTEIEIVALCELGADPNAVCPALRCGDDACERQDEALLFHAADGLCIHEGVATEALLRAGADPLVKDASGHTPLARAVASLCARAADYPAAFKAFFNGLSELQIDHEPMSTSREDFIAGSTPLLRDYVERFVSTISRTGKSSSSRKIDPDKLSSIVSLCAYEGWARLNSP